MSQTKKDRCCRCGNELPGFERRHGSESDVLGVMSLATILDPKNYEKGIDTRLGGAKDQPPINAFSLLVPGFWILEVEVLVVAHDSDATVRRGCPNLLFDVV